MTSKPYRFAFLAALLATPVSGEEPDGHAGLAPLFADHSVLDVTIEAPLTTLMEVRPDEDYASSVQPGTSALPPVTDQRPV